MNFRKSFQNQCPCRDLVYSSTSPDLIGVSLSCASQKLNEWLLGLLKLLSFWHRVSVWKGNFQTKGTLLWEKSELSALQTDNLKPILELLKSLQGLKNRSAIVHVSACT